ncbi:molybdopterin molybdotransferase MoeA [Brachybacterium sp.]|uniref:molybdopterin molybdotransferase MoeA n=1 Tax=Brachybacterium sp. TaxID=1891286 RepID=UPI002ECFC53E
MTPPPLDPLLWRTRLQREIRLSPAVLETPLEEAAGAVLGRELRSERESPAVPIAAMDGFAVRRSDLTVGRTVLVVSAELPARPGAVRPHLAGTAARIMTGASVPHGADAVIEVEATDADPFGPPPATVTIDLSALPVEGRHIRGPGEEIPRGRVLASPGDRVGGGLVGLAAMLGMQSLPVLRPLRVAVVVTGDELAGPGTTDEVPGAVLESNGVMLAAALRADGVAARQFLSGDAPECLREVLDEAAADTDLVLTTGGIGHGAYDVVKILLGERGCGTSSFEHLALRPGGPQGAGHLPDGTPVVHLPGTPVGALVGYHLFVRPLLPGAEAAPHSVQLGDSSADTSRLRSGTVHAMPGRLRRGADGCELVDLLPGRRLAPYGRADAIVLRGAGGTRPGMVQVLRL